MSQQPTQIQLPPMIQAGGWWFAPQAILAIDFSTYTPNDKDRLITVFIVGPHEIEMVAESADVFRAWWDTVTGQTRIQPAPSNGVLHLPSGLKHK